MSNLVLPRSQMPVLSLPIRWWSVTLVMVTLTLFIKYATCYKTLILLFLPLNFLNSIFLNFKESTWLAACCTEGMLYQRMSTQLLQQLKPKDQSNSSIGVLLDSRWESTTSLQPLCQGEISLRYHELFACWATPLPSLKHGQGNAYWIAVTC